MGDGLTASTPLKLINRFFNVGPLVSLAAKLVGSGPNRLRMVRLSHELNDNLVDHSLPHLVGRSAGPAKRVGRVGTNNFE